MKILIAIGCNDYIDQRLPPLFGAENDAIGVFEALVEFEGSIYDPALSRLLLSPTYMELKDALQQAIFIDDDIELSVFFAGHGSVKDGAYFLCTKDTVPDRMTVSAVGLTELFLWINEACVNDTNIVIDACESGGVAYDVTTLLKPRELGKYGSPSLSVLAASASNQAARELDGHGVATLALLKCLRGDAKVLIEHPTLTLFEVGYKVSEIIQGDAGQTPVSWGLNLFGRTRFCANPNYSQHARRDDVVPVGILDAIGDASVISNHTEAVWELYLVSPRSFDSVRFLRLIQSILDDLPVGSRSAPAVVDGLATTFLSRLSDSRDPFERAELLGACIASLLPFLDNLSSRDVVYSLSKELVSNVDLGIQLLLESLEADSAALLSPGSMLGDLYFLPIRLLKILGWAGAAGLVASSAMDDSFNLNLEKNFERLIRAILSTYASSVVAVSDEQACTLLVFLRAAQYFELDSEAEEVFGLMCHSLHKFSAQISEPNLSGEDAFRFTTARSKCEFQNCEGLIAKPAELVSVILLSANQLSFEDIVDDFIADFDYVPSNLFVPDAHSSFAQKRIEDGVNFSYRIGHGVWRASDFVVIWDRVQNKINDDSLLKLRSVRVAALCSALVQPDRTPWFIWANVAKGEHPL